MQSKYTGFPEGFEHLETLFQPHRARIEQIIDEIENMPNSGGAAPAAPRPVGAPAPPPQIPRAERIAILNAEKENIQKSMHQVAKDAVRNADPKIAKEVIDKTEILGNPDKYEIGEDQANKERIEEKDLSDSQISANRLRFDNNYQEPKVEEKRPENKDSLKGSIDKFFDEIEPENDRQVSKQEPEKTKEQKFAEMKDNKHGIEKDMEKFFNETAPQYVDTRNDIVTKEPSFGPGQDD